MLKISILGKCTRAVNWLICFIMSKNNEKFYYAVGRGREIGIFESWKECKAQVDGVSNPKFRKFFSKEEAEEFVNFWKNYSSPSKESANSGNSVSSQMNGGRHLQSAGGRTSLRINGEMSNESFSKLGGKEGERRERDSKHKSSLTPYKSPIRFLSPSNNYFNSTLFRNRICHREREKPGRRSGPVEGASSKRKNNREPRFSVNEIKTSETDFQFLTPGSVTSSPNPGPVYPKSDSTSVSEGIVKKEIVEIENERENIRESKQLDVGDKLATCLKILESALQIITVQNDQESARVKNGLKALARRILSVTNDGVNPQMDGGHESADKCQETAKSDGCPPVGVEAAEPPAPSQDQHPQHQQHHQHQSPSGNSKPPSFFPSPSFEGMVDQKNVDVLALNLRLDSFEKRFDACLKEVGAIASEMSHIKSEIKELKESRTSTSGSGYSPKKSKGGLTQSTLNFGARPGFSVGASSSRCFSTGEGSADSGEPEVKRGRSLKRKLSRSGSLENKKQDADDGIKTDEILSKIKMEAIDYMSFSMDADGFVEVYTDGACHFNGKEEAKAGIGIWFGVSHPLNTAEPVDGRFTNNAAEIQAARVAIELAIEAGVSKLKIHTDSEFLINCISKWMPRWKKNGWTLFNGGQVKNRKELEKLDKVASKITIRWEKVLAHSGIYGNEMADRLANEGAAKCKS